MVCIVKNHKKDGNVETFDVYDYREGKELIPSKDDAIKADAKKAVSRHDRRRLPQTSTSNARPMTGAMS